MQLHIGKGIPDQRELIQFGLLGRTCHVIEGHRSLSEVFEVVYPMSIQHDEKDQTKMHSGGTMDSEQSRFFEIGSVC